MSQITDEAVAGAISKFGPRAMTYVIANILDRKWPTSKIRRHLEGMERRGLVERVSTGYAVQICWALKSTKALKHEMGAVAKAQPKRVANPKTRKQNQ